MSEGGPIDGRRERVAPEHTHPPDPGSSGSTRPPDEAGTLAAIYNECVHCGFCLPVCPTYDVLGTEMDNPRGRLYLMRALEEGRTAAGPAIARHLDLCLGCRACETECPSGVPYGAHLEKARERLRSARLRPLRTRLLEGAVLRSVALPVALQRAGAAVLHAALRSGLAAAIARGRVGRILPRRVRSAAGLLAGVSPRSASLPALTPARGERRMRAAILEGCISRWLYGHVNEAAARLLAAAGVEVAAPPGQGCCGALHLHSGDREGAKRLARKNIEAFERSDAGDAIVVTAAGCGSAMKDYGALFEDDPAWRERAQRVSARVRDALELLSEIGPPPARRELRATVAYHDACHLAHAQGVRAQPRALLAAVPGVTLVPLEQADRCCGSAGIYNLLHPDVASEILREKLARLKASGATVVAAANPGCLLQIASGAADAGLSLRVVHPLEILDEACREGTGREGEAYQEDGGPRKGLLKEHP